MPGGRGKAWVDETGGETREKKVKQKRRCKSGGVLNIKKVRGGVL